MNDKQEITLDDVGSLEEVLQPGDPLAQPVEPPETVVITPDDVGELEEVVGSPEPKKGYSVLDGVAEDCPDDLLVLRCVYEDAPPGALIHCRSEMDVTQVGQWSFDDDKKVTPVCRKERLERLGVVAQWKQPGNK